MTAVKPRGLTRRSVLGGVLSLPSIQSAWAQCPAPSLKIRVSRNFSTFDPADSWGEDAIITRNLLAPLVRYKKREGTEAWEWERHLVESITEGNPRNYQFQLRSEAWLNSSEVTAEDVAFSFCRIAGIAGGLTDAGNRPLWSSLVSVDVMDSTSAKIVLNTDKADLLKTTLPGPAGCIVSKKYVSNEPSGRFTLNPGPTSGRYRLCDITPGISCTLTRDDSWRGDPVEIESAQFLVIENDQTAQELWLANQIDVYRPNYDVLKQTVGQGQPILRASTSRTCILVLSQNGPLKDPQFRRAVQLSINRSDVGFSAYADKEASLATGLVPRGWPGWTEKQLVSFDPDEGRRLVPPIPGPPLRIGIQTDDLSSRIAEVVKSNLSDIGVTSEVLTLEAKDFWFSIAKEAADIMVLFTAPQTYGALAPFEDFTSKSGLGWNQSEEFDALYSRANADAGAQHSLQELLINEGIVVPLVEGQVQYLLKEGIRSALDPDGFIGDLGSWGR